MLNILTVVFFGIFATQCTGNAEMSPNVHMNLAVLCPAKIHSCINITNNKERVVTVLDDGLQVMCDTKTDGGGWIVFQRRINGNVSFYRGWEEYKYGFGDFGVGEFYLGNEHIYRLTSVAHYELRLDILFENKFYFAQYKQFRLLGENSKYTLKINGYSGNASDQLDYNADKKFSTFDSDSDETTDNCAKTYQSAWWFKHCSWVNLNENWGDKLFHRGVNWGAITTLYKSANFTEMKMRRVK